MRVKNKGSWCEKHNQYARTKFDCPHCELDELRERVAWMLECEYMHHGRGFLLHGFAIIEIADSFLAARKSVEELL